MHVNPLWVPSLERMCINSLYGSYCSTLPLHKRLCYCPCTCLLVDDSLNLLWIKVAFNQYAVHLIAHALYCSLCHTLEGPTYWWAAHALLHSSCGHIHNINMHCSFVFHTHPIANSDSQHTSSPTLLRNWHCSTTQSSSACALLIFTCRASHYSSWPTHIIEVCQTILL